MKETRRFVGSPVSQQGGAPQSRKLHPGPQRPSEDSCEGLHHLSLKDDEVPLLRSPQFPELESKSGYPPSPTLRTPGSGCRSLCRDAALAGVAERCGRSLGRAGRVSGARGHRATYLGSREVLAGSDHCVGAARASTRFRVQPHGLPWHDLSSSAPSASWHAPRAAAPCCPGRAHPPGALRSEGWAWSRGALAAGTPTAPAAGLGAQEPDPCGRHPSPRLPDAARALVCRKGQNCDTEGRVLSLDRVKRKNFWKRNQKSPSLY